MAHNPRTRHEGHGGRAVAMPDYDPRAIHDLGAERGWGGFDAHWKKTESELKRLLPNRRIIVVGTSLPIGLTQPPGYDLIAINVMRRPSEDDTAFAEVKRDVERILDATEMQLTQPRSGSPYFLRSEGKQPEPIWTTSRDGIASVVGWIFLAFISRGLVKAEDIEFTNEMLRRASGVDQPN